MKVGSYVVCTDDKFSAEQLTKLQTIPKEGDYYTIRNIVEYPNLTLSDGTIHEPTFSIFRFMELEIPPGIEQEISEVLDQELELVETEDDRLLRKIHN